MPACGGPATGDPDVRFLRLLPTLLDQIDAFEEASDDDFTPSNAAAVESARRRFRVVVAALTTAPTTTPDGMLTRAIAVGYDRFYGGLMNEEDIAAETIAEMERLIKLGASATEEYRLFMERMDDDDPGG